MRELSESPEGPEFIENQSTRKLSTVGEVREDMRRRMTVEVRQEAEDFLVGIDAITAASKHLKGSYVNKLRVAVQKISAALAEITHRVGFDSAEDRISALKSVNDRLLKKVKELRGENRTLRTEVKHLRCLPPRSSLEELISAQPPRMPTSRLRKKQSGNSNVPDEVLLIPATAAGGLDARRTSRGGSWRTEC